MPHPPLVELTALQTSTPPVNTVAPAVTGNKWVGQVLSCTTGTWTNATSYAYQWKDAGGNIAAATSSTYTVGSGEVAATIHCTVTATGGGGSVTHDSNSVGTIGAHYVPTSNAGKIDVCANTLTPSYSTPTAPANSVAPAVVGTTTVGQSLSCSTGTWTDDGSPTFTYQWQRDTAGNLSFSNIGAATSNVYTLVDADDGNKVRCVVTDTDGGGNTSANSNAVGLIVEAGVPVISVAPAVTGTTTVGQVLSSTTGTWTNQGGSVHTYAYQWQRDVLGNSSYSNISSATSSTYTLVDADDACHIKCLVTATNDVGASSASASNVVGVVAEPAPSNSVAPALGGDNAHTYAAITCSTGTWSNMGGYNPSFTYQWRDCATSGGTYADITGATNSSYGVPLTELNKFLKCVVTAHNTQGTATATTVASAQVAAGTAPPSAVNNDSFTSSFILILSGDN